MTDHFYQIFDKILKERAMREKAILEERDSRESVEIEVNFFENIFYILHLRNYFNIIYLDIFTVTSV